MATDSPQWKALERARTADPSLLSSDLTLVEDSIRAFADLRDPASALELFARAWRGWLTSGRLDGGRRAAGLALAIPGSANVVPWYCRALYADGVLAFRQGDQAGSLERNNEALRVAREKRDAQGEAEALTGLARIALRDGDYERVIATATHARGVAHSAGDASFDAAPLHLLAAGVRLTKDYVRARELYRESLELNRRLQRPAGVAMEEHNLGWVSLHLGDVDAAEEHFRNASERAADPNAIAWRSLNAAGIALARGRRQEARAAYASGKEQLRALQQQADPDDRFELEWMEAALEDAARSGGAS
jgi:tetratricopeptide (TPR) repeat protein